LYEKRVIDSVMGGETTWQLDKTLTATILYQLGKLNGRGPKVHLNSRLVLEKKTKV